MVKESARKPLPPGPGRPKGIPNKTTALLKDAILKAADVAGGEEGLVGYLTARAKDEPVAFMSLLGKVLPMQVTGADGEGAVVVEIIKRTYGSHNPAG